MHKEFDQIINCGLLSGKRRLLITPEFLYFQKKKISLNRKDGFSRDNIAAFKFEMRWLRMDITFGRRYTIVVSNKDGKEITIRFSRYFGIGAKTAHKLYAEIVDTLENHYFLPITHKLIDDYNNGKQISINKVAINEFGINIRNSSKSEIVLPWNNIRTQNYYSYFAIYDVENPADNNFTFSYADDWNTTVLYSVVRAILQHKNIEQY